MAVLQGMIYGHFIRTEKEPKFNTVKFGSLSVSINNNEHELLCVGDVGVKAQLFLNTCRERYYRTGQALSALGGQGSQNF
jgi:hypothetical protein